MTPIVDGVVSPSGTLYERSTAVEYLVRENAKLSEWREKYEKQCEEDERLEQEGKRLEEEGEISSFAGKQAGLTEASVASHVSKHEAGRLNKLKAEGYDIATDSEVRPSEGSERRHRANRAAWRCPIRYANSPHSSLRSSPPSQKKNTLKRTSYWLSDWTPDTGVKRVEAPPKRPSSPFSGNALRLKDLKSVELKRDADTKGATGTDVAFICAVSGKRLTTQEIVAITKSGTVMLKSNYEEFAKKEKVDPVKGVKFKDKDVVELRKSATGYASSGKVEAEVYTPTMG